MDKLLTDNQRAVLWLAMQDGLSLRKKKQLLSLEESPKLFEERCFSIRPEIIRVAGEQAARKLFETRKDRDNCEKELSLKGWHFVDCTDGAFPENLKEIPDSPIGLFVAGDLSVLKNRSIAVVGTRKPTRYAAKVTEQFTREFVRAGLTVVSGLARGIDSTAHIAALEENGITVAVLGSGLDVIYPSEHKGLAAKILESGGALVSEYPLGEKPLQFHFLERNRLVSGLSEGVFLPEAGKKSGSLNTVNHAIEQGKEVFIIPSTINNPASEGSNALLRDELRTALVIEPSDVLKEFGLEEVKKEQKNIQLSFVDHKIMTALEKGEEVHFEQLLEITGLSAGELGSVLFELELNGLVDKLPGNFYAKG